LADILSFFSRVSMQCDIVLPILSACPSVYTCVKMNGHIIFLMIWWGHHSSFLKPTASTKFQGEPLSGALNTRGWENFSRG